MPIHPTEPSAGGVRAIAQAQHADLFVGLDEKAALFNPNAEQALPIQLRRFFDAKNLTSYRGRCRKQLRVTAMREARWKRSLMNALISRCTEQSRVSHGTRS
jgi:hypothetical protein